MIPLLLLLLIASAQADHRSIKVVGRLNCADRAGNWYQMSGVNVTLWEEDLSFESAIDPHDIIDTYGPTDYRGKFALKGGHGEFLPVRYFISIHAPYFLPVRYFISIHAHCKGDHSWQKSCAAKEFVRRCSRRSNGYEPKRAFFTHRFEYNPDGVEFIRRNYNLTCGLGLAFTDGFTCGGSLCKGQWCGHEIE